MRPKKRGFFAAKQRLYILTKDNTVSHPMTFDPSLKHSGGSVMVLDCFVAFKPTRLATGVFLQKYILKNERI